MKLIEEVRKKLNDNTATVSGNVTPVMLRQYWRDSMLTYTREDYPGSSYVTGRMLRIFTNLASGPFVCPQEGRLARRLKRHAKMTVRKVLPDVEISHFEFDDQAIANMCERIRASLVDAELRIKINRELWYDGEFGDSGSCWFNEYEEAPYHIFDNGGYALKVYNVANASDRARCWLAPTKDRDGEDVILLFNGYANDTRGSTALLTSHTSDKMASILSSAAGLTVRKVRIGNNGKMSGYIYINSDTGYALKKDGPAIWKNYDLGIDAY